MHLRDVQQSEVQFILVVPIQFQNLNKTLYVLPKMDSWKLYIDAKGEET